MTKPKTNPNQHLPEPPKEISIAEARKLSKKEGIVITWRPVIDLPEDQQYCLIQGA